MLCAGDNTCAEFTPVHPRTCGDASNGNAPLVLIVVDVGGQELQRSVGQHRGRGDLHSVWG